MHQAIEHTIAISAPPARVWEFLTLPHLLKQWMGEPEMQVEVSTDWKVGGAIVISGFHHVQFENKGIVLHYEPHRLLQHNYISSISRLPPLPGNATVTTFELQADADQTLLKLTVSNFPTESIFRHQEFYWRATVHVLKGVVEC